MRGEGQEPREAGRGVGGDTGTGVSEARAPGGRPERGKGARCGAGRGPEGVILQRWGSGCRMGGSQRWGEGSRHLRWGAEAGEKCGRGGPGRAESGWELGVWWEPRAAWTQWGPGGSRGREGEAWSGEKPGDQFWGGRGSQPAWVVTTGRGAPAVCLRCWDCCGTLSALCPAASASQGGLLFPGTSQETKQASEAKKIPPSALLCEQRASLPWTRGRKSLLVPVEKHCAVSSLCFGFGNAFLKSAVSPKEV